MLAQATFELSCQSCDFSFRVGNPILKSVDLLLRCRADFTQLVLQHSDGTFVLINFLDLSMHNSVQPFHLIG